MSAPLLVATGLSKRFGRASASVAAVNDVSLSLWPSETLGLVGPSGSGKSTVARLILRLVEPDAGAIMFAGEDWLALRGSHLRTARRHMQTVFQDPLAAFNPRATVFSALAEPLRIHRVGSREERRDRAAALLRRVELEPALLDSAVHEISGGQRQRVAIARALAPEPRLVVLDEATSALDVSLRGAILRLLADLQRERGIAYLFISHDLAAVRALATRLAVMDAGRVVEEGETGAVVADPQSAVGRALVAAVPRLRREPSA